MWKHQSHKSSERQGTALLFLISKWPANWLDQTNPHQVLLIVEADYKTRDRLISNMSTLFLILLQM